MRTEEARAREMVEEVAWLEGRVVDGEVRGELEREGVREEVRRVRVGLLDEEPGLEELRVLLRAKPAERGLALSGLRTVACDEANGC